MRTKEELNSLKEEVENLSKKFYELTDEELQQVFGGENPSSNITQALQNRIAGVDMQQTNSQPGAEMRIRIRGQRSLSASDDSLVVLD